MSGQLLKQLCMGMLIALSLQCSNSSELSQEKRTEPPLVTFGEGRLGLVRFPQQFTRNAVRRGVTTTATLVTTMRYEVRQKAESRNELLFGMIDLTGEGKEVYSDNFYAVTLDGGFKVRAADAQEEWSNAQVIAARRPTDPPFTVYNPSSNTGGAEAKGTILRPPVVDGKVKYQGKWYPVTGKTLDETILFPSPDGRWLAVFSDTTEGRKEGGIIGGRGRTLGEMYVDVYDTASGEKVMAGQAQHLWGSSPGELFRDAFWLESRFLVVPLEASHSEACFLGILPR